MAVEEELKKDHAEMQAVIDAKQKIIDAQVGKELGISQNLCGEPVTGPSLLPQHCSLSSKPCHKCHLLPLGDNWGL